MDLWGDDTDPAAAEEAATRAAELAQQHKDKKAAAQKAENERKAAEGKARSAAAKEAKEKAKEGAATDGEAARQPPPSKETEEQEEQEEGEAVVLDVKPWDDETDLVAMEAAVRALRTHEVQWGRSQLVPHVYGLKKLQIACTVRSALDGGGEALAEAVQELEDYVNSCDMVESMAALSPPPAAAPAAAAAAAAVENQAQSTTPEPAVSLSAPLPPALCAAASKPQAAASDLAPASAAAKTTVAVATVVEMAAVAYTEFASEYYTVSADGAILSALKGPWQQGMGADEWVGPDFRPVLCTAASMPTSGTHATAYYVEFHVAPADKDAVYIGVGKPGCIDPTTAFLQDEAGEGPEAGFYGVRLTGGTVEVPMHTEDWDGMLPFNTRKATKRRQPDVLGLLLEETTGRTAHCDGSGIGVATSYQLRVFKNRKQIGVAVEATTHATTATDDEPGAKLCWTVAMGREGSTVRIDGTAEAPVIAGGGTVAAPPGPTPVAAKVTTTTDRAAQPEPPSAASMAVTAAQVTIKGKEMAAQSQQQQELVAAANKLAESVANDVNAKTAVATANDDAPAAAAAVTTADIDANTAKGGNDDDDDDDDSGGGGGGGGGGGDNDAAAAAAVARIPPLDTATSAAATVVPPTTVAMAAAAARGGKEYKSRPDPPPLYHNIVVMGKIGAGKSTVIKHIAAPHDRTPGSPRVGWSGTARGAAPYTEIDCRQSFVIPKFGSAWSGGDESIDHPPPSRSSSTVAVPIARVYEVAEGDQLPAATGGDSTTNNSKAGDDDGGSSIRVDGLIWVLDCGTINTDTDNVNGTRVIDTLWAEDGAMLHHALLNHTALADLAIPLLVFAHKTDRRRPGMPVEAQWTAMDTAAVVERLGLHDALPERMWRVVGSAVPPHENAAYLDSQQLPALNSASRELNEPPPVQGVAEGWEWLRTTLADPATSARQWFGAVVADLKADLLLAQRELKQAEARAELQVKRATKQANGVAATRLAEVGEQVESVRGHYARRARQSEEEKRQERKTTMRLRSQAKMLEGRLAEKERVIVQLQEEVQALRSAQSVARTALGNGGVVAQIEGLAPVVVDSPTDSGGGGGSQLAKRYRPAAQAVASAAWVGGHDALHCAYAEQQQQQQQQQQQPQQPQQQQQQPHGYYDGLLLRHEADAAESYWRVERQARRAAAARQIEMATLLENQAEEQREQRAAVSAQYQANRLPAPPPLLRREAMTAMVGAGTMRGASSMSQLGTQHRLGAVYSRMGQLGGPGAITHGFLYG